MAAKSRSHSARIETVTRVQELVREAYTDPGLSLNRLAIEVGVSRSHLSRIFRVIAGLHFREYLRELRVNVALGRLLADPTVPIKRIALEAGFSNTTALDRAFRSTLALSPSELREKAIESNGVFEATSRIPRQVLPR